MQPQENPRRIQQVSRYWLGCPRCGAQVFKTLRPGELTAVMGRCQGQGDRYTFGECGWAGMLAECRAG